MRLLSLVAVAIIFVVVTQGETMVWDEEFNSLDLSRWSPEVTMGGGGNGEFQVYLNNRTNSYVRDGVLFIRPTLTADHFTESAIMKGMTLDLWGSCTDNSNFGCRRTAGDGGQMLPPIQSSALRSINSFSMTYGRLEIRAKLPRGDWIWPAIWMLPTLKSYGDWPASGEIDIMESRGNLGPGGVSSFGSTLHWGPFWPHDPWQMVHGDFNAPAGTTFADDFHVFGLLWTDTKLVMYLENVTNVVAQVDTSRTSFWQMGQFDSLHVDNPWAGRGNNAPFDQGFHIILNVAVGGTQGYFPDSMPGKPWKNNDPFASTTFWNNRASWLPSWKGDNTAMQIDWIHAYSL